MRTKRLVIMVGVPGSGKSTIASKLAARGYVRISADDIREELYGDAKVQGNPKEVFGIVMDRFIKAVNRGSCVVIDNTNVTRNTRSRYIKAASRLGYEVFLFTMQTDLQTCLQRNRLRKRVVPEEVIRRMWVSFRGEYPNIYLEYARVIEIGKKYTQSSK